MSAQHPASHWARQGAPTAPSDGDPVDRTDLHRQIVEGLEDGVYIVDPDRTIETWNAAAERISGFGAAEVVGRQCFDNILNHVDDAGNVLCFGQCPLARTIEDGQPRSARIYLRHRDGHRVPVHVRTAPLRDAAGQIVGASEVFSDASPLREVRAEADELRRLAFVDELTGLPNRRACEQGVASRLSSLARHGWRFGLLVVDVDDFKDVNDGQGHVVGDRVLQMVGRTIANACRAEDFVSRWGGDEFVVLVAAADSTTLENTAERIRVLVSRSRWAVGQSSPVSVSIGGTIALGDDGLATLFDRADTALYEAKASGRDRVRIVEWSSAG